MPCLLLFSRHFYGITLIFRKWGAACRNTAGDCMSDDIKSEQKESADRKVSESCCYVVDPCCGYVVDPCGCYVDPCGCYVDPCCC